MNNEYCWVQLRHDVHYRRMWKLTPNEWNPTSLGMLAEGYTQSPGWHVIPTAYAPPVATLPRTMSMDEAKDAAKMILLSLKQMENS